MAAGRDPLFDDLFVEAPGEDIDLLRAPFEDRFEDAPVIVVVEEGVGIVPGKERERLVEGRPPDRIVPALGDVAVGIVGVVDGPGAGDGVRPARGVGVADPVLGEDVADVVVGDGPRRLPAHLALGELVEVVD